LAGIGIISNPHSKLNRKNPQRHGYLTYLAGQEGHVAVTRSLTELEDVAQGFKRTGVKLVAINGGDGTISHTITALIKAWDKDPLPKIALLRGGTINVLAENLGIKGSPEEILYRLIEEHYSAQINKTVKIHTIEIEGRYGFLFANGVCANFLQEFYKNKSGPLGSILLILKIAIARFINKDYFRNIVHEFETSIFSEGVCLSKPHQSLATLAATIKKMPLGPKIFPKAGKLGEEIQCISYVCPPLEAIFKITKDVLLTPNRASDVKICLSSREFDIFTNPRAGYTLDGELYPGSDKVTIKLGPEIEFVIV